MQIAVIDSTLPSANQPVMQAITRAGLVPVAVSVANALPDLASYAAYVVLCAEAQPAICAEILTEQATLGKPIIGIGAGAEALVNLGLVPGLTGQHVGIELIAEQSAATTLYCKLSLDHQHNIFTRQISSHSILAAPGAAELKKFNIPSGLLMEMEVQGLNLFQYCDANGIIDPTKNNIAAVTSKEGNVLAIVPHIEALPAGDVLFRSMRHALIKGYRQRVAPLHYLPR